MVAVGLMQAQLPEDARDVLLHGAHREHQRLGDAGVGTSLAINAEHLLLAWGGSDSGPSSPPRDTSCATTSGSSAVPPRATRCTASTKSPTSMMRSFSR